MNNLKKIIGDWDNEVIWQEVSTGKPVYNESIDQLYERMEKIMNHWDGEQAGIEEERAVIALEITQKINQIKDLLIELPELK